MVLLRSQLRAPAVRLSIEGASSSLDVKPIIIACYLAMQGSMRYSLLMEAKNTITQMRRGILEYCIVSLLAENEIYTAELIARLKAANLLVTDGTLYPLLNRLQKAELLQYRWEESESGPPRKYYSLTEVGTAFLNNLDTAWKDITKSVESIRRGNKSE